MTDKELLKLAAKAAGIEYLHVDGMGCILENGNWNPLTDDGDALRLAVKLRLNVRQGDFSVFVDDEGAIDSFEINGEDSYASTRRAIVKAAAQMGKTL